MGKYSNIKVTLKNGEEREIEVSKDWESINGKSYSIKGNGEGVSYSSIEAVMRKLETGKEQKHTSENNHIHFPEINRSFSVDNNSLDDSFYDVNGNDTNGHYDDDGDYWAPGHSEVNCD